MSQDRSCRTCCVPTGSNWNEQSVWIGMTTTGARALRLRQRRIGRFGQRVEQREVGQRGQRAAGHDDRLAPDLVRQPAEEDEERRADHQRDARSRMFAVERRRPSASARGRTARRTGPCTRPRPGRRPRRTGRSARACRLPQRAERFGQRRLRGRALVLHLLEDRAFVELQPDPQRNDRAARSKRGRGCASPTRRTHPPTARCARAMITSSERNRPSVAVVWIQLV